MNVTITPPLYGLYVSGQYSGAGNRHVIVASSGYSNYDWFIDYSPTPVSNNHTNVFGITKNNNSPTRHYMVIATDSCGNTQSVEIDY